MTKNKKMILSLGSLAAVAAPIAAVVACGSGSTNIDDGFVASVNVKGASQVNIKTQMQYDGGQDWNRGIGYEGISELTDVMVETAQLLGWDPLAQDGKYFTMHGLNTTPLADGGTYIHEITSEDEKFKLAWNDSLGAALGIIQDDGSVLFTPPSTSAGSDFRSASVSPVTMTISEMFTNAMIMLSPLGSVPGITLPTADELKAEILKLYDLSGSDITSMVNKLKSYTAPKLTVPSYFNDDALGFIGAPGLDDQYSSVINEFEVTPGGTSKAHQKEVVHGPWKGMHYAGNGWFREISDLDNTNKLGKLKPLLTAMKIYPRIDFQNMGLFKDINNPGDRFVSMTFRGSGGGSGIYDRVHVVKQTNVNFTDNYIIKPDDKAAIWNADGTKTLVNAKAYYKGVIKTMFEKIALGMTETNASLIYGLGGPSSQTAISTLLKNKAKLADDAFIDTLFNKLNKGQTHWAALSAIYTGVDNMTDENGGAVTGITDVRFLGMKDIKTSGDLVATLRSVRGIGGTKVYWKKKNSGGTLYSGNNTKYQ